MTIFQALRAAGLYFLVKSTYTDYTPNFFSSFPIREFSTLSESPSRKQPVEQVEFSTIDRTVTYFKATHLLIRPEIAFAFPRASSLQ
jgi:hypothetical protein